MTVNKKALTIGVALLLGMPNSADLWAAKTLKAPKNIYHKGWTDFNKNRQKDVYENPSAPLEKRVNDLLSRMTLEEKIEELNLRAYYEKQDSAVRAQVRQGKIGALLKANGAALNRSLQTEAVETRRLGIPLMFHEDVIHGYRTILPIPLGESCCWDRDMVRRGAALAAEEAAAASIQLTYAPMVDISTDPRWGRIMETSGEDAMLCSALAEARVKGFQGDDLKDKGTVMACVKHFAGYAALRGGRDYQNTDFSLRELQEIYLPPYKAAIEAGVGSVMCSYTTYDGEPVTMNRFINHDILRNQLKFQGLLMSDWTTFNHAVNEGAAANGKEAAGRGMNSGLDMDMASGQYSRHLKALVEEGVVSEADVTAAARRALIMKFSMGLFDNPYAYFDEKHEAKTLLSPENKDLACELTTATMVLLKNDNRLLPLSANQKIAVVGPFASDKSNLLGRWSMMGKTEEAVSVEEGLKEVMPQTSFNVAGCPWGKIDAAYIASAVKAAEGSDVVVACLGENKGSSGEAVTYAKIELPEDQVALLKALKKTGKKIVTVLFNGRPLALTNILNESDAILEAWHPGTMGGKAVALLLSGQENPSGKLTQTFPRHCGQVPLAYNERRTFQKIEPWDLGRGPLFPFGFGLSYTKYEYSDLKVNTDQLKSGESLKVSVNVKNVGDRAGREVVQLYIRDEVATIVPREKELRDFASVTLNPGEQKTVEFTLTPEAFMILNNKMQKATEPGSFLIMVGTNSQKLSSKKINISL